MKAVAVTDNEFKREVIDCVEPVIVDFWASWCQPCKRMLPIIDELAVELKGKVKVTKVDIDDNPNITNTYGIKSVPTLMLLKNGVVQNSITGYVDKKTIISRFNL